MLYFIWKIGGTHDFQATTAQDPLCCSYHITPVPLQIPHDASALDLWEHLLDALDISFSCAGAGGPACVGRQR